MNNFIVVSIAVSIAIGFVLFVWMLLHKLYEVNKEFIAGNTDNAIGEICDLIVFAVNAIELKKYSVDKNFDYFERKENNFELIVSRIIFRIGRILDVLKWHNDYIVSGYDDLIAECYACIFSLGYSPEIALEQTVLKIESRRGTWDESIGKWVKDKSQTDVYTPDYSLARLK